MHLREACIAQWQITADPFWHDHAEALLDLAARTFSDAKTGALVSLLADD